MKENRIVIIVGWRSGESIHYSVDIWDYSTQLAGIMRRLVSDGYLIVQPAWEGAPTKEFAILRDGIDTLELV